MTLARSLSTNETGFEELEHLQHSGTDIIEEEEEPDDGDQQSSSSGSDEIMKPPAAETNPVG